MIKKQKKKQIKTGKMYFHVKKLLLVDIEIFGCSTNVVNFLRKAMQSQERLGHVVQEVMIFHLILRNSLQNSKI